MRLLRSIGVPVLVSALLCLSPAARAEPGEELLAFLEGTWACDATLFPSALGPGLRYSAEVRFSWGSDHRWFGYAIARGRTLADRGYFGADPQRPERLLVELLPTGWSLSHQLAASDAQTLRLAGTAFLADGQHKYFREIKRNDQRSFTIGTTLDGRTARLDACTRK